MRTVVGAGFIGLEVGTLLNQKTGNKGVCHQKEGYGIPFMLFTQPFHFLLERQTDTLYDKQFQLPGHKRWSPSLD